MVLVIDDYCPVDTKTTQLEMSIINDYYPELPKNATLEQRMIRKMLQIIEEKEFCDGVCKRLGISIRSNSLFDELKTTIRKLTLRRS